MALRLLPSVQKNIPVAVAVMISPSLIESSMFFFFNLNCSLIYRVCSSLYLRRTVSFQWFYRLFLDLFFIQSLRGSLVIGERCTSTYGYNYTNTLYIDITIPSDNTGSRDDAIGYNIGSITACIAGIPATTFCYLI